MQMFGDKRQQTIPGPRKPAMINWQVGEATPTRARAFKIKVEVKFHSRSAAQQAPKNFGLLVTRLKLVVEQKLEVTKVSAFPTLF